MSEHEHDNKCPICHGGYVHVSNPAARWPEPYPGHDLEDA